MDVQLEKPQIAVVTSVGLYEGHSAESSLDTALHMGMPHEVATAVGAFVRSQRENKSHTGSVNRRHWGTLQTITLKDGTAIGWSLYRETKSCLELRLSYRQMCSQAAVTASLFANSHHL
jgi:hypothetical protein